MYLGVIADDITGGTDVASVVKAEGLSVVQTLGVPSDHAPTVDVIVVSLKIRSVPVALAVQEALDAGRWLRALGARQLLFKYCSTFDSTARGNIGPVVHALLAELGSSFTVACPAYPSHGRTVYRGHLFVGDELLSESPMRDHPITPMTESNLVRLLQSQMPDATVGLVPLDIVRTSSSAVRDACTDAMNRGVHAAVIDATSESDLATIAEATSDLPLVTGAAGLARAIAARQTFRGSAPALRPPGRQAGNAVVLSGSCSPATMVQVRHLLPKVQSRQVHPVRLAADADELRSLVDWAVDAVRSGDVMLYSTAGRADVYSDTSRLGTSPNLVEDAFRNVAVALRDAGVRVFVVAGGETSGAILSALGTRTLQFGENVAPGVPTAYSIDPPGFAFALKSGNFGGPDFFSRALRTLRGGE